jgi:hypothetical protein
MGEMEGRKWKWRRTTQQQKKQHNTPIHSFIHPSIDWELLGDGRGEGEGVGAINCSSKKNEMK